MIREVVGLAVVVVGYSVSGYNIQMNDLRLLLQADKDRKIINLEFK